MSSIINIEKNVKYYEQKMSKLKNKNIHIGLYTKKANENHLFIFRDNNAFMRYFIPNIQKLKTSSTGKKIVLYEINDAGLLYLIQYWERNSDLSLPNFSLPMPSLYKNSEGAMYRWDNEKINDCIIRNIPITNEKLRKMIGRELIDKPIFAIHVVNKKMLVHDGISRRLSFTCPLDKNGCISKKIVMSKLNPSLFLTNYYEIISNAFHVDDEKDKLRKEKDALLKRLKEIQEQESSDKESNYSDHESLDEDDSDDDDLDSQDLNEDNENEDENDDDDEDDDEDDDSDYDDDDENDDDDNNLDYEDVDNEHDQDIIMTKAKPIFKNDEELKKDLSKSLNVMLNTNSVRSDDIDIIPDTEDIINIATPDTIPTCENSSLPAMDDTQEYMSQPDEEEIEIQTKQNETKQDKELKQNKDIKQDKKDIEVIETKQDKELKQHKDIKQDKKDIEVIEKEKEKDKDKDKDKEKEKKNIIQNIKQEKEKPKKETNKSTPVIIKKKRKSNTPLSLKKKKYRKQ